MHTDGHRSFPQFLIKRTLLHMVIRGFLWKQMDAKGGARFQRASSDSAMGRRFHASRRQGYGLINWKREPLYCRRNSIPAAIWSMSISPLNDSSTEISEEPFIFPVHIPDFSSSPTRCL